MSQSKKQSLDSLLNRPQVSASTSAETRNIRQETIDNPTVSPTTTSSNTIAIPEPTFLRRNVRFEDIQASFRNYDGQSNFDAWIDQFEEQSMIFGLNDIEKFIYAKKLMVGTAQLFTKYESQAKTFFDYASELHEEFGKKHNSAVTHEKLRNRHKNQDETTTEYLYSMLAIAAEGDVELQAVITYIVQGLPGPSSAKSFMLEAENMKEFKKKLAAFDTQQKFFHETAKIQSRQARSNPYVNAKPVQDPKATKVKEERKPRMHCYNCGDFHRSEDCPNKEKGPKCFNCNQFGHRSDSCPSPKRDNKPRINMIRRRAHKEVELNDVKVKALIDTGSDYTVVSEDIISQREIKCDFEEKSEEVKGVGGCTNLTGAFPGKIKIDDEIFETECHTIPKKDIDEEMIIGMDIIDSCELIISPEKVTLKRWKKQTDDCEESSKGAFSELCSIDYLSQNEETDADLSHISDPKTRAKIEKLISEYKPTNINECPVEMEIVLTDEKPVSLKPRRLSPQEKTEVEKQVSQWFKDDVIQHSFSDFSANIVIVPKKDATKRLCVDYRLLNKKIIKDRFPMPHIEDQIDDLERGRVFTTLDLKNGYFHVPIKESSRKYTSFVTHTGQYEFKRVPFGLCNSPAIFNRFIHFIFQPLIAKGIVKIYMDDIIIIAKNENEAIERLEEVLKLAASYNLSIKWKKCSFLKTKIEFLGYEIENGMIKANETKTNDVNKYKEPKNPKEVQRFLGFAGYFRKFIDNFVMLAKPLSDLMRNNVKFTFGPEQRKSFETLKQRVIEQPVLMIFRKDAETELHTDASKYGTAAILMQRNPNDNEFHPVHFMSVKTSPDQEKWISYELELFAIILALRKFRNYLQDIHFKIVTDCEAIQTAVKNKNIRKIGGWLMELEQFDYELNYRPASKMQHVDALSRMYVINTLSLLHQIRMAQNTDDYIKAVKEVLTEKPYDDFVVHNDLLCKYSNAANLVVVPEQMQISLIKAYHEEGHFKNPKLEKVIKKEFFIPDLRNKINQVIQNCVPCILIDKHSGKKEGFLHPIPKEPIPLDTLHLDHLGPMANTKKDYKHILAIVDSFTKFTWLFPVKTLTSNETLKKLEVVTAIFGNPRRIIADRGTAFTSNSFKEFCEQEGIELSLITTGVPRGNGQVERIHRIVIGSLAKLSIENPERWFSFVNTVQKFLNNSYQRSIQTTPFQLMFGFSMKNQLNEITNTIEEEVRREFDSDREQLRRSAAESILKVQTENKRYADKSRKEPTDYQIGDLVAISKTQFMTQAKLKPKNAGPYKVTKVKGNERFEVEKIGPQEGPLKTNTSADNMKPWPVINMIRRMKPLLQKTYRTISIEGNIGSGKSTILQYLSKSPNVEVYPEPVEKWTNFRGDNLLEQMYANPTQHATNFQLYAMQTMLQIHLNEQSKSIKVMERSIYTIKHCFLELMKQNDVITSQTYNILNEWISLLQKQLPINVERFVYLRTDPEVAFQRVQSRGRPEEKNISMSYIISLHELHEAWLGSKGEAIILNGNQSRSEILVEYERLLSNL